MARRERENDGRGVAGPGSSRSARRPGHEAAVVSLLRDWLCRPGERLLDLKGIRVGS